jgi:hypothetical protein
VTLVPVFLDAAKNHAEPGFLFSPPHKCSFRLSASALSDTFKRFGIQEMDFAWWDAPEQTMNLLEVKDYSRTGSFSAEHYVNECAQKATDCLLLLGSIWYGLPYGPRVSECVPEEWHTLPVTPRRLHLYFVMKEPQSKDPLGMSALQDKVKSKVKGRIELLDLTSATTLFLMNHHFAASKGLPITTPEAFLAEPVPARPKPPRER